MSLQQIKQAIIGRIKDFGDSVAGPSPESISNRFWNSAGGDALVSAQNAAQNGNLFSQTQYENPQGIAQHAANAVIGLDNNLFGKPFQGGYQMQQAYNDTSRLPITNPKLYQGLKNSAIGGLTALGAGYYPGSLVGGAAFKGAFDTAGDYLSGNNQKPFLQNFAEHTLDAVPSSALQAGALGPTQSIVPSTLRTFPRLVAKGAVNVATQGTLRGLNDQKVLDPTSITIDALFPAVMEGVGYLGHKFADKARAALHNGDEKALDVVVQEYKDAGGKVNPTKLEELKSNLRTSLDSRPAEAQQAALEDAFKANDIDKARLLINSIPDSSAYKMPMKSTFETVFGEPFGDGLPTISTGQTPSEQDLEVTKNMFTAPGESSQTPDLNATADVNANGVDLSQRKDLKPGFANFFGQDDGDLPEFEKQKIRNSIAVGRNLLRSGKDSSGNPLSVEERIAIRKSIANASDKIGENLFTNGMKAKGYSVEDVTPAGYGPDESVDLSQRPDLKPGYANFFGEGGGDVPGSSAAASKGSTGPQATGGTTEQVFKTKKFNLDDEQAATLDELRKSLGYEDRPIRSFEDMKAFAEDLGSNPAKLLQDVRNGRITDSEVVALSNIINNSSQRIQGLAAQIAANPEDLGAQAALEAEQKMLNTAIGKQIKGGTEAGRAVVAFKILANNTMDPAFWLAKAQRQLGDKPLTPDDTTAINDLISKNDRLGLASYVSGLGESTLQEKVFGLWKAGLLTGFKTHEANIAGNTTMGALENIKDYPAVAFDMARSAITGGDRAVTITPDMYGKEAQGFAQGTKQGWDALTGGNPVEDLQKMGTTQKLRFGDTTAGKFAQKYTDAVFGALTAADKPFKQAAFMKSLSMQAAVEGLNEGLTGDQIAELVKNPTQEMLATAKQDSLYSTFNQENQVANAVSAAKMAGGKWVKGVLDFVMPFVKVPANVAGNILDYGGKGLVRDTVKKILDGSSVTDKQLAESFGRAATGAGLIGAGIVLAKAGKITGALPSSPTEQDQFYLEGKQPNSILIGGKWRNISRIATVPMTLMVLGAEYANSGGSLAETGLAGLKSYVQNSFLQGVSGALDAVNDPARNASKYVNAAVQGVTPNLVRGVATATDDLRRNPKGAFESFKMGIPGLRESVRAQLDPLGDRVKQAGTFAEKMFDPTNPAPESQDPIVREAARVGYNLSSTGSEIANMPLTQDQKDQYQILAGKYIRETVSQLINSDGYRQIDIDTQKTLFKKAVDAAKERARVELKPTLDQSAAQSGYAASASTEDPVSTPTPQPDIQPSGALVPDKPKVTLPDNYYYYNADNKMESINFSKYNKQIDDPIEQFKSGREKFAVALKAYRDSIPDEKKAAIVEKLGLDLNDVKYYDTASETEDVRRLYVDQIVKGSGSDREKMFNSLISARKSINGRELLTDPIVTAMYNEGTLTKQEADILKNIVYKDGQFIEKPKAVSTAKGKAKSKKINFKATGRLGSAIKQVNLNLSSGKAATPIKFKVSEAQLASLRHPKIAKLK